MLYRVAGKLTDSTPFTARIEAASTFAAAGTARASLIEGGKQDTDVAEIRVRPAKGSTVRFGKQRDQNAPKKVRTAKPASAPANDPAKAPVVAGKK